MSQPQPKLKIVKDSNTPEQLMFLKKMYDPSAIPFCIMDIDLNILWSNQAMRHICPDILCQGRFSNALSVAIQWLPDFLKSDGCFCDLFNGDSIFATNGFVLGKMPGVKGEYYYLQAREVTDKGTLMQPKGTTQALAAFESVIREHLNLILKNSRPNTPDLKKIKLGANNIYRMMLMTKDYAQLSNGLYPVSSAYIELISFCIDTLECIGRLLRDSGTEFTFHCDYGIYYTQSSSTLLTTILCHIVSNAVRYGNKKEVSVDVAIKDMELTVTVTNWGNISMEDLPQIYEPYRCFPPPGSGIFQGYGLGLTIARAGAIFLGGGVSSICHNGQTFFRLRLPVLEYSDKYRIRPDNNLQGYPDHASLIRILLASCL